MLTHGKRDYLKLVPILAPDWDELDDEPREQVLAIAKQLMEKSLEIFNEKAKFVTVGQMYWTKGNGKLSSWDPKAEKLCVGFFGTEKQAEGAAFELIGAQTADEHFRVWTLPIWHGTPGAWRKARRKAIEGELSLLAGEASVDAIESALTAAKPRCTKLVPNDEGDFVTCIRVLDHPGSCFPEVPSMNGAQ